LVSEWLMKNKLCFSASLTEAKKKHHAMFCKTFALKIYLLFTFASCPNTVKTGNVQESLTGSQIGFSPLHRSR